MFIIIAKQVSFPKISLLVTTLQHVGAVVIVDYFGNGANFCVTFRF